jgi:hypothetical protein
MRGIGIRVILIALVAVGAFVLRDRISSNASDLQVGDCFDVPASTVELVDDVQHHPCTETHTGEVVLVRDYDGGDTKPTDDQWRSYFETHCVAAFNQYTGLDYVTDTVMDLGFLVPGDESWKHGDRGTACYVVRIDGAPMSASVKAR